MKAKQTDRAKLHKSTVVHCVQPKTNAYKTLVSWNPVKDRLLKGTTLNNRFFNGSLKTPQQRTHLLSRVIAIIELLLYIVCSLDYCIQTVV